MGAGIAASRGGLGYFGRFLGVGAGIAVAKDTIDSITSFDSALAELRAQANLTSDEIERLSAASLAAGRDTKFTATQSLETAKELARSGQLIDEVEQSLRPSLDLAAVAQIEGSKAAVITARSLKQFNLEASESKRLIDELTFAASQTTAGVAEFARAGPKLFPAANAAGLSSADALAFAAVLADAGFVGEQGGVAGRNLIINLQQRQQPGQSFFDTLSTLSTEDLDLLGAKDLVNQRGAAPLLATLQNVDRLRSLSDLITNQSDGDAARRAAEQIDNVAGAWTLLGSAIENVQVQIGQAGGSDLLKGIGLDLTAFVRGIGGANLEEIPEDMRDLAEAGLAVRNAVVSITDAADPFLQFLDDWDVRASNLIVNMELLGLASRGIGAIADLVGSVTRPVGDAIRPEGAAREERQRRAVEFAQRVVEDEQARQRRQAEQIDTFRQETTGFFQRSDFAGLYESRLGDLSQGGENGFADRRRGVIQSLQQEERALGLSTRERQAYNATVAATGVVYAEIDPQIQQYVDRILGMERTNIVLQGAGQAFTDLGLQALFAAEDFESGAERILRAYSALIVETIALQPASEAFIGLLRNIGISLGIAVGGDIGAGATSRHIAGGDGVTINGSGNTPGGR